MPVRVTIAAALLLAVAGVLVAAAYALYPEGEPAAYDLARSLTGDGGAGPLGGLARAVSRSTYELGSVRVEGEPEPVGAPAAGGVVAVSGYIVVPAPGVWRAGDGRLLSHVEVQRLLAEASYVAAEGRPAEAFIPGLGRVKLLVAHEIELVVDGDAVKLVREALQDAAPAHRREGGRGPWWEP